MISEESVEELTRNLVNQPNGMATEELFLATHTVVERTDFALLLYHCKKNKIIRTVDGYHYLYDNKTAAKAKIFKCANLHKRCVVGRAAMFLFEHKDQQFNINHLVTELNIHPEDVKPLVTELEYKKLAKVERRTRWVFVQWSRVYDYPFSEKEFLKSKLN